MPERLKGALRHGVFEKVGCDVSADRTGVREHQAEMPALPRHVVAQLHQAMCHAGDRPFVCLLRARSVQVNTQRQEENAHDRCSDVRGEMDGLH